MSFNKIAKKNPQAINKKSSLSEMAKELKKAYEFALLPKEKKEEIARLRDSFEIEATGLSVKYQKELETLEKRYMLQEIGIIKKLNLIIKQ